MRDKGKEKHWIILGGILFAVMAFPSQGQAYIWQGLEITPRVSAQETYDDNVTYLKDNPIHDAVTNLGVGIEVKKEEKTSNLTLDGNVARKIFANNNNFDNTSEDLRARYEGELSKHGHLTLSDTFRHATDPGSFQDAFGRTNGLYGTYQNNFHVDYRHDMTEEFAWDVRYGNEWTNFARKDLNDTVLNTIGTGADYSLNSATKIGARYDYSLRDFNRGDSLSIHEVSAVTRHLLTKQLYLDLQAGEDLIHASQDKDFTHPMYRVALTDDLNELTQTGITFTKQVETSAYTQDLRNSWSLAAHLSRDISRHLEGILTAFYGKGHYMASEVSNRFTGVEVGVKYSLTRNTAVNMGYSYSQEESTDVISGYIRNAVTLGAMVQF